MRYACNMNYSRTKKLRKWTWRADQPEANEPHFIMTRVIAPAFPGDAPRTLRIEAVFGQYAARPEWTELRDDLLGYQGWH